MSRDAEKFLGQWGSIDPVRGRLICALFGRHFRLTRRAHVRVDAGCLETRT